MLPTVTHILYATDLSKNSTFAFRYAVKVAQSLGANITILYTLPALDSAMEVPIITQMGESRYRRLKEEQSEETIRAIRDKLHNFCAAEMETLRCDMDLTSSVLIREGDTVDEILNVSKELGCDLIVMGAHGKGILAHTFLGSVSEKVLRRSRIPVLVVPIPKHITDDDL